MRILLVSDERSNRMDPLLELGDKLGPGQPPRGLGEICQPDKFRYSAD